MENSVRKSKDLWVELLAGKIDIDDEYNITDSPSDFTRFIGRKSEELKDVFNRQQRRGIRNVYDVLTDEQFSIGMVNRLCNGLDVIISMAIYGDGQMTMDATVVTSRHVFIRFRNENEVVFVIQHLNMLVGLYFLDRHILYYSYGNEAYARSSFNEMVSIISDNIPGYSRYFKQKNSNFIGLILSTDARPAHFFYDFLPALVPIDNENLLQNVPNIYYRSGASFLDPALVFSKKLTLQKASVRRLSSLPINEGGLVVQPFLSSFRYLYKYINSLDTKLRAISRMRNVYSDYITDITLKSESSDLVVWVGAAREKRDWLNQNDYLLWLITYLESNYNKYIIIVDGMTCDADTVSEHKSNSIYELVKNNISMDSGAVYSLDGSSSIDKIIIASKADIFITSYGTDSFYVSRLFGLNGIVHRSNRKPLWNKHIHHNVHDIPEKFINVRDEGEVGDRAAYDIDIDYLKDVTVNLIRHQKQREYP